MSAPPRSHGRELHALLLAVVWAVGFEALPLQHIATHASSTPHTHGLGEAAHEAAHARGESHSHDRSAPQAFRSAPISHGAHSVAHRDLAAKVPLPSIGPVPVAIVRTIDAEIVIASQIGDLDREPTRARGPPAA